MPKRFRTDRRHKYTPAARKRVMGHAICRSHGNILNWERAQWRDQEAREIADFLAVAEEIERQIAQEDAS
jgi:hypothetical protein